MQLPDLNTLSNDFAQLRMPKVPYVSGYFNKQRAWAHIVTKESCPELFAIMDQCNKVLKPKKPIKLVLYESKDDYRGAFFSPLEPGCVFASVSCVKALDADDNAFIFGHEMGHGLHARRALIKFFLAATASMQLGIYLGKAITPSSAEDSKIVTYGLQGLITALAVCAAVRSQEYKADQCGIDVVKDPEVLIRAFRKFDAVDAPVAQPPKPDAIKRIISRARDFLSTHPSDIQRLEAAKKYASKKGYIPNPSADKDGRSNAR